VDKFNSKLFMLLHARSVLTRNGLKQVWLESMQPGDAVSVITEHSTLLIKLTWQFNKYIHDTVYKLLFLLLELQFMLGVAFAKDWTNAGT